MNRRMYILIGLFICFICESSAQQNINTFLNTYNQEIKVCNTPYGKYCAYETNYVRTNVIGNKLTIEYGFAYDKKRGDYTSNNKVVIDLSTALIYTGFWSKIFGSRWEHYGDKTVLTIEDKNGIDLYESGAQNYNRGTKQNLVEYICFSFGTEPLANRALSMFQQLQQGKRLEKEPWLVEPKPENSKSENSNTPSGKSIQTQQIQDKGNTTKTTPKQSKTSKSRKYAQ